MNEKSIQLQMRLKTFVTLILCILGAGTGSYFLYLDLNESGMLGSGKPLGQIEKRESTVRRKTSSSFVWTKASIKENLFLRDSIQTGKESAASIRLNDGTSIDMGENSLIVIDDNKNISLSYLRGSIVLHKTTGDQKLTSSDDGKINIENLSVRLIHPESLIQYFVVQNQKKKMSFSWSGLDKKNSNDSVLEISTDSKYKIDKTQSYPINGTNGQSMTQELNPGKYFWRILNQQKQISESRSFQVKNVSPLKVISPHPNTNYEESNITFRWLNADRFQKEDFDNIGKHWIEVSEYENFKSSIRKEEIQAANEMRVIENFPEGIFYWRIVSQYKDFTIESSTLSFNHKKIINLRLSVPENILPAHGTVIQMGDSNQKFDASWNSVKGASQYELQVFKKTDNKWKKIFNKVTEKTELHLGGLQVGDYYWNIRALGEKGALGEISSNIEFKWEYKEILAAPVILSPEVQ